jgi:DNA repair protein RecO (recombination protein O)
MSDRYYKTQGIILRTYKLGEADKIAVLYTKDYGKIRAVVKGVRKPTSKLGAIIEPGSLVDFYLYRTGGELQKIIQAVNINGYKRLKSDLDKLNEAFAILETVDRACEDSNPSTEIFTMLTNVLKWLDTYDKNIRLVFPAFCLKLMLIEGAGLVVDYCIFCNKDVKLVAFEMNENGFSCEKCRKSRRLSETTINAVRQVLGGTLRNLLETDSLLEVKEFELLSVSAMEHYLGAQIKSFKKSVSIF